MVYFAIPSIPEDAFLVGDRRGDNGDRALVIVEFLKHQTVGGDRQSGMFQSRFFSQNLSLKRRV